jgi:hypothetical protein
MITADKPRQETVDDFGKASTRPNCRKGNLKPNDHLKVIAVKNQRYRKSTMLIFVPKQGSAVFMNEKSFKPEKSGKKVNISPQVSFFRTINFQMQPVLPTIIF